MPSYKLSYFDVKGRGEAIRLALHYAGIPFVDDRIKKDDWPSRKESFPFGQVPVLEIDGKFKLAQTAAILRYVGRLAGLYPEGDPLQAAKADMFIAAADDLAVNIAPLMREQNEDRKAAIRDDLVKNIYPKQLSYIEKQVGTNGHCFGDKLTVADISLYTTITSLCEGGLLSADKFPNIKRICEKVAANEKIASWGKTH